MTIRVIGAGFGRTGTDSMREALNLLGFGPCHHMRELIADKAHERLWRDVAAGGAPDWDVLLGGYGSCVDWPSAYYWPELIEAFPEAKVILTWRTPESWWASFERTILPRLLEVPDDPESQRGELVAPIVFQGRPQDRDHSIALYEANVARVKATVPADRLLVYKLGDGWGPLCAHLGVPVPDAPYPHSNTAAAFNEEFQARS